jgi:hypothetical protein
MAKKGEDYPLQARRFLSYERFGWLRAQGDIRSESDGLPPNVARVLDIQRMAWTEFVGVASDDPRLNTVELFKI